jgi:hypothetical protein
VASAKITRWLTLGANLGVLIGIALVLVELDQNREMMRAQIRNELALGIVDLLQTPASVAAILTMMSTSINWHKVSIPRRVLS